MAELSEVLALRMENFEQQQREVAQLRAQVVKLQQCCRSVRWGLCGAPSSCQGHAPFPLPPPHGALSSEAQGPSLGQCQSWRRPQRAPCPVPSSQVRDRAQRGTRDGPGTRSHDSLTFFGFIPRDFFF